MTEGHAPAVEESVSRRKVLLYVIILSVSLTVGLVVLWWLGFGSDVLPASFRYVAGKLFQVLLGLTVMDVLLAAVYGEVWLVRRLHRSGPNPSEG